ncbi:unnamed protein product [Urochloa humidicola]
MEKTDITRLELEWFSGVERFLDDVEVLRELEPPYSVTEFRLQGYNSISFPWWVMRIGTYLPDLTRIEMSDLPTCSNLPPLGQLPNLKWLDIRRMDEIEKIGMDLYGGTRAFPRLEEFRLDGMKYLVEWITAFSSGEDDQSQHEFPCLRVLEISHCPRLRFKGRPPQSHILSIGSSDGVMLSSWWSPSVPAKVEVQSIVRRVGSSADTHLYVSCCAVPLQRWSLLHHLPRLKGLMLAYCSNLTCSSVDSLQGLTSLRTLNVTHCESLPEWLGILSSLTRLEISDCTGIKTLPGSIQLLTRLDTLRLKGCESMEWLPEWLGDLTSFANLTIIECRGIKTLPSSIQKLTRLEIYGCPDLVQWCELEENKMKLAHVKTKYTDEESETDEDSEIYEESETEYSENYEELDYNMLVRYLASDVDET